MKTYDFDKIVERRGTGAIKTDALKGGIRQGRPHPDVGGRHGFRDAGLHHRCLEGEA